MNIKGRKINQGDCKMKKFFLVLVMLIATIFVYATQIEVVGEVFASYSG